MGICERTNGFEQSCLIEPFNKARKRHHCTSMFTVSAEVPIDCWKPCGTVLQLTEHQDVISTTLGNKNKSAAARNT